MIRKVFNINNYWKVIVYYNVNYNFFNIISKELKYYGASNNSIKRVYDKMSKRKAKGVTISFYEERVSVVLFNTHKSYYDYVNSIVHEAEHIKQAMLKYYSINDEGEEPAYTIGYLAMKMLMIMI